VASSKRKSNDTPTVKAVLVYAAQLRERADAARLRDPHIEPYRPSNDAARKVSQKLGPEAALTELAKRAWLAEQRYEEGDEVAAAGRERLVRLQLVAAGERGAERERLTLGQRLDVAMLGLKLSSDVSAVQFDADPVSGGKPSGGAPLSRRDRQLEDALYDVRRAVERLERELDGTRRRLVELEVAA
jgi:hypothetical protein